MAKPKTPSKQLAPVVQETAMTIPEQLLDDVRALIAQTRQGVAQAVNSALVLLYWQVGQRIRTEVLKEQRAEYG